MAARPTVREIPLGDPRLRDFVRFHWRHYRGHPRWVPQLDGDLLGNRLLGLPGQFDQSLRRKLLMRCVIADPQHRPPQHPAEAL